MIQGDVIAFVSVLIGSCISAWALTLAYGFLFPGKTYVAKLEAVSRPGLCVGRGVLILATAGLVGVILAANPSPPIKLAGTMILLAIFSIASLGMAGVASVVGDRMRQMAPELSPYAAFSRGAAILIVGCVLPIVGWLAFGPVLYLAAIGAGWKALVTRIQEAAAATAETA